MLKNQKAFTLIELMVSLTVLGISIALAVPGFNSMIINNRSATLGEEFASVINYARSESVKRGIRISLCATKDGLTCGAGDSWTDGYMAFADGAATDKAATPTVGVVLKAWDKPHAQAEISVKSGAVDLTFLRFTALGTLARVNTDTLSIKVNLKKCTGEAARKISVGLSGMVNIERTGC